MPYTVDEIRERTGPIAKSYGIKQVNLFGSYARGEATKESDIDLYIDKGRLKSLIQYFSFVLENATDHEKAMKEEAQRELENA